MLLMRGMMTKFMLTNIFGEPYDYILEKFGKADVKNGEDWINDNKPEPEDTSHENVDDFNKDTWEVCLYDVENEVHSTENNVEVQELFDNDIN